ncbi:hypothetical protein COW46_02555 [Candidatus Gracilibacteria bacterium CG17_big_fil_post_rev_8_21_14_2_50_48_13]|nr:MAG: hypothetical protein COW46_02555 [Candidatus Gracilibacteria bacterium CG17_big_fil_post_rev_8_21_14_2_50_48_13]
MKAIILCGGGGTRLWPLSREQSPKQFHRLVNNYSLLQDTVRRISPMVKPEDIFISTNKQFVDEITWCLASPAGSDTEEIRGIKFCANVPF